MYNVTAGRLCRDGDAWKESHSFGPDDLLVLAFGRQKAYSWIGEQRRLENESQD
jgi:hypothetical protein